MLLSARSKTACSDGSRGASGNNLRLACTSSVSPFPDCHNGKEKHKGLRQGVSFSNPPPQSLRPNAHFHSEVPYLFGLATGVARRTGKVYCYRGASRQTSVETSLSRAYAACHAPAAPVEVT
eukprot:309104-Amphidinium_carterae.1